MSAIVSLALGNMRVTKVLKDGTTHVKAFLADETELEFEVRPSTKKEMEINSIPPFIAICADGVIEPTTAGGYSVEDSVGNLLEKLNQRYVA